MSLYRLIIPRFRARRMRLFAELMQPSPATRVLDVGGTPYNWSYLDEPPHVTLLNLADGDVWADGRKLPFRDGCFDVAFSNSTIEHVGDASDHASFAGELRRVARSYFVQTPNRYFPVEPHYMTPFVQFLPKGVARRIARNFTLWGLANRPDDSTVEAMTGSINLLSASQLQALFPDAEIQAERLLGMKKSLIAVRRAPAT